MTKSIKSTVVGPSSVLCGAEEGESRYLPTSAMVSLCKTGISIRNSAP